MMANSTLVISNSSNSNSNSNSSSSSSRNSNRSSRNYIHNGPNSDSTENAFSVCWTAAFASSLSQSSSFSIDIPSLRSYGTKGCLRFNPIRGVMWQLFLDVLPSSTSADTTVTDTPSSLSQLYSQWIDSMNTNRCHYENTRNRLIIDPRIDYDGDGDGDSIDVNANVDLQVNNPLSQAINSPWNQFFKDKELREEIEQDVRRTFPENEWFQLPEVHTMMLNILFCYARSNSGLSYKQGMHELLAPILYVYHTQAVAMEAENTIKGSAITETMRIMCSLDYVEHDSYTVFIRIMDSANEWFQQGSPIPLKTEKKEEAVPFQTNVTDSDGPPSTVLRKLQYIQNTLLREHDLQLYDHLNELGIEPQLYGLRWLRLLFGREFHFDDVLVIWDGIFAFSADLALVDYICVSLLSFIGSQLITCDYTGCLKRLMKFPPVEDVCIFIEGAIDMHNQGSGSKAALNIISPTHGSLQSGISTHASTEPSDEIRTLASGVSSITQGTTSQRNSDITTVSTTSAASSSSSTNDVPSTTSFRALFAQSSTIYEKRPSRSTIVKSESSNSDAGRAGFVNNPKQPDITRIEALFDRVETLQAQQLQCASKLEVHVANLERALTGASKRPLNYKDSPQTTGLEISGEGLLNIEVALAGLKQVRDVLRDELSDGFVDPLCALRATAPSSFTLASENMGI